MQKTDRLDVRVGDLVRWYINDAVLNQNAGVGVVYRILRGTMLEDRYYVMPSAGGAAYLLNFELMEVIARADD